MAIGKRFKKKMKNPRAGNSYWAISGWPLKTHIVSYMKENYEDDPCYAFYEDDLGVVVISTEQNTVRNNRYLNGQTHYVPVLRTKTQAVRFLNQIKQGLYPRVIASIREFHEMMDDDYNRDCGAQMVESVTDFNNWFSLNSKTLH